MFSIKLTPRENTKLLKYRVIIESTTLMCLRKVDVFLYHTKSSSSSIILINWCTNPKLIPSRWANLNYKFEKNMRLCISSFFATDKSSNPKNLLYNIYVFLTYFNTFPLKCRRWTVKTEIWVSSRWIWWLSNCSAIQS